MRTSTRGLPNSAREKLLQMGLGNVARVLDGLMMVGVKAGDQLSATAVHLRLGALGIGRNTIFNVLKTTLDCGQAIFIPAESPPPLLHLTPATAAKRCAELTKQCLFGTPTKPGKKRGRPSRTFIMPAVSDLCRWLGVKNSGGDALPPEALKHPADYRAALHGALFERAPGQYPRRWLSRRLGVCDETCRRYERRLGVQVRPMYRERIVTWIGLDAVVPDEVTPGMFLETSCGRRFPALQAIARRLLAQGYQVRCRSRDVNDYRFADVSAQQCSGPKHSAVKASSAADDPWRANVIAQQAAEAFDVGSQAAAASQTDRNAPPLPAPQSSAASEVAKSERRTSRPGPVDNAEARQRCATLLYDTLRRLNAAQSVTRKQARAWVKAYGIRMIERGLKVLEQRSGIRNPAGFLQTWLRSQKAGSRPPSTPRCLPPQRTLDDYETSYQQWMAAMESSPYAEFYE
jgi:hypothetical protein